MNAQNSTLLRILLNAYYGNAYSKVCNFLPEDIAESVKGLNNDSKDFSFAFRTPEDWLKTLHYSWIAPAVTKFPTQLRPYIAASLPEHQSYCVRQYLALEKMNELPLVTKRFMQKQLFDVMELSKVTPKELLPSTPFRMLVDWNKHQLCSLIDHLSMFDLADKLRHIVDRKRLRDIYACLDKEHLEFLRQCMHVKEKLSSSQLKLDAWKGEPKELAHLLHRRGLIRLGLGLIEEPEEVMWYINHNLDSGRSAIIEKCRQNPEPPAVLKILAQQLKSVIEYLDTKRSRE